MQERSPIFELHIRPMFRALDRVHMTRIKADFDLWDYDSVKTHAQGILARIGGPVPAMPTRGSGGAWPNEWVKLFERWMITGYRRLTPVAGRDYAIVAGSGGRQFLQCKVDIPKTPQGDAIAWLDMLDPDPDRGGFQLCVYTGDTAPPPAETVEAICKERLNPAAATAGVTVIDAAGSHTITV